MNKETYTLLENYMLSCMEDSAHDCQHVYRVLYEALEIAKEEKDVDYDILITACLLHDIGRKEQFENPKVCHAVAGAEKAYDFLMKHGFDKAFADKVAECIHTHRYRKGNPPKSIEAKILFDADKIDVAGAIGIARTLVYKGSMAEPLYTVNPDGSVSDGENDSSPSFFQEYKYKLEGIYSKFFTEKGEQIAKERQKTAVSFYNSMLKEMQDSHQKGQELLKEQLTDGE